MCIMFQIDVEKLAGLLPLHLIAVLMSSDRDEALLRYLLCGIRLLHSLCELAPRHAKLEQVGRFRSSLFLVFILLFIFCCITRTSSANIYIHTYTLLSLMFLSSYK